MKIYDLVVEPGREEHIARHHVSVAEVEEVVEGNSFISRTREGRYRVIGQTEAGRYLSVILVPRGPGSTVWLLPEPLMRQNDDFTRDTKAGENQ